MLDEERFFRFGLDLQLEEVDPPEDMSVWAGKPGFVEENLETVLSVNLHVILPEEQWLAIGRQESNVPDPDLTVTTKACDLVFFEVKKNNATPAVANQNLGYWIRSRADRHPHCLSRYLRLQCNREWVEPVRLLGLAKGSRLDLSGPVRERNLQRLKENNDTGLPDEQFLSQARNLLRDRGSLPLSEAGDHSSALVDAFRSRFGFGDHELLRSCLGKSVSLAFVAPAFSEEFLEEVRTLWSLGIHSCIFQAELYRHESDPHSFLLSFNHLLSDDVMSQELYERRRFLGFIKEELFEFEARELQTGRNPLGIPLHKWEWSYPTHNRQSLRFHPRQVSHFGDIDLKKQEVRWALQWMNMGTRPRIRRKILSKLREVGDELPPGMREIGRNGNLVSDLEVPHRLNRAGAEQLARKVFGFLKYTFELYDSCGLWDDPYDDFAKPS